MPIETRRIQECLWAFARQSPQYAMVLIDDSAVILWASPGAENIFASTDLAGRALAQCFPEEDVAGGVPDFELAVARSRGWIEDDRWMQRFDGSRFWAEGMTVGLHDDAGAPMGFLKVLRNRTQQKMITETLRNQIGSATQDLEGQRAAIATIVHELRNPLATMQNCSHVLEIVPPDDERATKALAILKRSLDFSVRLVGDLLEVERGALGKLALQFTTVRVEEVLRSSINTALSAHMSQRRIDLLLPDARLEIEADAMRLQQVFVNLVGNAIRYTPEEGRIWVSAVEQGDSLMVKVEDTGSGIDPDDLDKIFDLFSQATVARGKGGLGIGLALVKQIVGLHNGTVQAQSDGAGKGSQFYVRLPMQQKHDGRPADG